MTVWEKGVATVELCEALLEGMKDWDSNMLSVGDEWEWPNSPKQQIIKNYLISKKLQE